MIVAASWALFGLLALLWTGGAFLAAELVQWAAQVLADGRAAELGRGLATLPVPQWLSIWMDPALVEAVQGALAGLLELAVQALPFAGAAAGWLVPVVWLAWGFGLVVLLAAAAGVHFAARRWRRRAA